jgi:hypothetical protein
MNARRFLTTLVLLLAAAPVTVGQELATIELHNRPAEDLLPMIQPFLGAGDVVIPNSNQLIFKADPATIRELRSLVEQLDRSPHRLLVTVVQGSNLSLEGLKAEADLRVRIGSNQPENSDPRIQGHAYRLEGRDSSGTRQQVQTLEGNPAVIQVGEQIPLPSPSVSPYGYGQGIEYRPVTTGFSVIPRLAGSGVLIEIAPWSDRISRDQGGVIDTRSAHTTVQVALGEWVEIGGQTETAFRERTGVMSHSYSTRSRQDKIFLKVDDLDAGKR